MNPPDGPPPPSPPRPLHEQHGLTPEELEAQLKIADEIIEAFLREELQAEDSPSAPLTPPEDSPHLTKVLTSKEDAIKHASSLASGEFGDPLGFVNVHGPGYHSRKWNAKWNATPTRR